MSEMSMHATFFVRGDTPVEVRAVRNHANALVVGFNDPNRGTVSMHIQPDDLVRLVDVLKDALVQFGPAASTVGRDAIVAELHNVMRQGCSSEVSEPGSLQAV